MKNDEGKIREWMMFNFYTNTGEGIQKEVTDEGILKWHSIKEIQHLPMAEGDRLIIQHAIATERCCPPVQPIPMTS